MSEFSEKCKEYIEKSNTNIYQIAKKSGLDRTSIQKMVQGKRLPSKTFVNEFFKYLVLNKPERELLEQLYKIEKIGKQIYECRREVKNLLYDFSLIQESLEKTDYLRKVSFDPLSQANDVVVKRIIMDVDIIDAIQYVIIKAYEREKNIFIYMDMFEHVEYAMQQMIQEERNSGKKAVCWQFVKFGRKEEKQSSVLENIKVLRNILPFAFVFKNKYEVYYSYANAINLDGSYSLWPHYIVTEQNVLLLSDDGKNGMLIESRELAQGYISELQEIKKRCRPLFSFAGTEERLHSYLERKGNVEKLVFSYENTLRVPELASIWSEEKDISCNQGLSNYLNVYKKFVSVMEKEEFKMIYGSGGLSYFLKTGLLPGNNGTDMPALMRDERIRVIYKYCDMMRCKSNEYLLKEQVVCGLKIKLYEPDKIFVCSVEKESGKVQGVILIEEAGIFNAFLDYFESLVEEEEVYTPEESCMQLKQRCEEIMEEL